MLAISARLNDDSFVPLETVRILTILSFTATISPTRFRTGKFDTQSHPRIRRSRSRPPGSSAVTFELETSRSTPDGGRCAHWGQGLCSGDDQSSWARSYRAGSEPLVYQSAVLAGFRSLCEERSVPTQNIVSGSFLVLERVDKLLEYPSESVGFVVVNLPSFSLFVSQVLVDNGWSFDPGWRHAGSYTQVYVNLSGIVSSADLTVYLIVGTVQQVLLRQSYKRVIQSLHHLIFALQRTPYSSYRATPVVRQGQEVTDYFISGRVW